MLFNFQFGLTVFISDIVEDQISESMKSEDFRRKESGGILIGYIEPLNRLITITDITYPQRKDLRSPYRFVRNQDGHQEIMDDLWERSNFEKLYLGEWHTHCTNKTTPSSKDIFEWKRIASMRHNTPIVLFLIVVVGKASLWTVHGGEIYQANEVLQ